MQKIAAALAALPPDAIDKHRELFAASMIESLYQVPPTLKQYLVRHALEVVGDHPAAKPLAEKLAFYDDLLMEVELQLAVDGSDRVGHGVPFGVHVSLHGTRSVARENNAFSGLLIPPGTNSNMPPDMESRRRLEQALRESFAEGFEIEALAFHPPQTNLRSTEREGWVALPIAYVVLKSKDPAIDRLRSVQMDFDFSDGSGEVRLPVTSQVVPIDSHENTPPPRPAREVKIRQLLDDRELAGGVLRLEVTGTAVGVVPELKDLVASGGKVPGFELKRATEQEITVGGLSSEAEVVAQTERRWLIELEPLASGEPRTFAFPTAGDAAYETSFQRFASSDVVDAGPQVELNWPVLSGTRLWLWFLPALITVVAVVAIAVFVRRKVTPSIAPAYRCPDEVTPFAVIALLRRIEKDASLRLSATERSHLAETLQSLEDRFFRRGAPANDAELEPLCRKWVARAAV
jgi:hypothetical protein